MVNMIIGILMILSFFGMIWYCVKGHNLMVGFLLMAVLWVVLALIGNALSPNDAMKGKTVIDILANVFQAGPEAYGKSILVNIFFGAFFGRVLMDTGIAATLIRKVVELGGDKPRITMTLLCIITAVIFTSMTGIGPVI
ncbi:MAG: citrate transporter, partial [Oscillospiraceae bacterium]|nr:citrate transporter [Oscillospiraceae bacterium]